MKTNTKFRLFQFLVILGVLALFYMALYGIPNYWKPEAENHLLDHGYTKVFVDVSILTGNLNCPRFANAYKWSGQKDGQNYTDETICCWLFIPSICWTYQY